MNPPTISQQEQDELLAMAKHAYENAYAPYSNFRVGAAVLLASGEIFYGCNVENASYGLTNCAERTKNPKMTFSKTGEGMLPAAM